MSGRRSASISRFFGYLVKQKFGSSLRLDPTNVRWRFFSRGAYLDSQPWTDVRVRPTASARTRSSASGISLSLSIGGS